MSPAYKIQEWGGGRYRVTNDRGQQIGPLFSTEKAARTAGKDYVAHLRKLDKEIAAGNKAYRKGQSTMAKRRKRYGEYKVVVPLAEQAARSLRVARGNIMHARQSLRSGDCASALRQLSKASMLYGKYETLKRVAGRAESHRQDMASVAPYTTIKKLGEMIVQKCLR